MPIPNASNDFLKITSYFTSPGRPVMGMQTYWSASPAVAAVTDTNIKTIADEAHDAIGAAWNPLADSVCRLQTTRAQWYGIADDGYHSGWTNHNPILGTIIELDPASGLGEADNLPDFSALLLARTTSSRLRNKRGRLFVPCIAESANKGGYLQEEFFTDANALATLIGTSQIWAAITWNSRHWDRKSNILVPISQMVVMQRFSHIISRTPTGLNLPTP